MTSLEPSVTLQFVSTQSLQRGGLCLAAVQSVSSGGEGTLYTFPLAYRVGAFLSAPSSALTFQIEAFVHLPPQENALLSPDGLLLRICEEGSLPSGAQTFALRRSGISVATVILSDKGSLGIREDKCAPLLHELLEQSPEVSVGFERSWVIPDEAQRLKGLLVDLCLEQRFDLVLTSGGTGLSPRDITPEATCAVLEKRLPGFERAMTAASLAKTPKGALSRAVAGTLGTSLLINLPGSPKAVVENLEPLLPALTHAIEKLQGDQSDCAQA